MGQQQRPDTLAVEQWGVIKGILIWEYQNLALEKLIVTWCHYGKNRCRKSLKCNTGLRIGSHGIKQFVVVIKSNKKYRSHGIKRFVVVINSQKLSWNEIFKGLRN